MNNLSQGPEKDLHIEATKLFPEVNFRADGKLRISGRIISDHLQDFFTPLFHWVDECSCNDIVLEVNLDYLNSNGTFLLCDLLRRMESKDSIMKISVLWIYEEEDEEHYELGELIREKLKRTLFNYMSYV
jgi:hypothetical protein